MVMRIGVIGAGPSGLVTAKVLKHDGFEVEVFEKESTVGGVWAASRAYPGLGTNNPRETYVFSDMPHAATTDDFPSAKQVREYLEAYVDRMGLGPHLHLGTEVVSVTRRARAGDRAHPGFRMVVRPQGAGAQEESHEVDFVAVCNGVLSEPFLPRIKGAERFAGSILHSSQIPSPELIRGKRVVVVGAGKSALDCASFAGREAKACTLVFRRPYWMLPRYLFGRMRVDGLFSRWIELLTFPAYHELSRAESILRLAGTPLLPLLWLFRALECRFIARQSKIPDFMVPDRPLHAYIYHQGIGVDLYESLREGRVRARRASIDSFVGDDELRLDTGEMLEADVVICATGWRQSVDFLDPELRRQVRPDGRFRLYRHILPPSEPRLGFVGYASSGNVPLTSELAAHWLSQCFRGELTLPDETEMERSINRVLAWTEQVFPDQHQGHFIGGYIAHYADWLMRDLGLSRRRRRSRLSEWFGPFWAERYHGVTEERRRARERGSW
jgi:dimethylaniline monooxygenase (N-oxide forming)